LSRVYALADARAVAVGDFNNDGNLDAAVLAAGSPGLVAIFLGDGTGNLTESTSYTVGNQGPGGYSNIAVAKLHGGGKLDLVVTNGNDNTVSVLLGNGDGTFQPQVAYSTGSYPTGNNPQWVAIADVNKDGHLDLVTADSGQGISVLLGMGNGTFRAPLFYANVNGYQANGVAIADLNGDGNLDVVTAAQVGLVNVFLGNGDGTFQPAVGYSVPSATTIAIANLNGAKKLDLIVADFVESTTWVLLGNGDGTFKPGDHQPRSFQWPGRHAGGHRGRRIRGNDEGNLRRRRGNQFHGGHAGADPGHGANGRDDRSRRRSHSQWARPQQRDVHRQLRKGRTALNSALSADNEASAFCLEVMVDDSATLFARCLRIGSESR
jgi:hypothetical protein